MPEKDGVSTTNQYEDWTPIQLVNQVTSNAGAAGAGAMAELTRLHAEAMEKSGKTVRWLTWVIAVLTLAIAGLTIYLAVVAV